MQEELITERIENENVSGDVIRQDEDTIVKGVFGGILFNKVKKVFLRISIPQSLSRV
jgi:hypothetical protein